MPEELKSKEPDEDARIMCLGHYRAIYDWKWVDTEQKIAQGRPVIQPGMQEADVQRLIFFSRAYHPESSDLDKIFPEIEIKRKDIIGVPFLLVSKEKLLFGWEPASATIARPPIKLARARPRGLNL